MVKNQILSCQLVFYYTEACLNSLLNTGMIYFCNIYGCKMTEFYQFRHVYRVYKWQISWVSYPRTVELPFSSRESRFHKDDDDTSLFISLLVKLTGPISAQKFQEHKLNPLSRQGPGVEV